MKLRLSSNKLTFRITNQEYLVLLEDKSITENFILPDQDEITYKITIGDLNTMYFKHKTIELVVTSEQIENLKLAPKKTGLENCYSTVNGEMTISLEIDLKLI
ncbi:MAG: hypothetical protein KBD25_00320 [Rickettsiaceae bacterium]|nr:hypothetical protein [Rickettsiaceae bacterium]